MDAGHDVWLGNFRGNSYGLKHTNPAYEKDVRFWQFSWEEHGRLDLPATLGYVKRVTGVSQISYIGHSMGTTALFVMFHHFPEMKNSIRDVVALAPVAYLRNLGGLVYWFTPAAFSLCRISNLLQYLSLIHI